MYRSELGLEERGMDSLHPIIGHIYKEELKKTNLKNQKDWIKNEGITKSDLEWFRNRLKACENQNDNEEIDITIITDVLRLGWIDASTKEIIERTIIREGTRKIKLGILREVYDQSTN